MNSYTLTERLRKARRRHTLSAGAQGLFYELVAINNEEQWSGVFKCPNGELMSALNISEKTLIAFRDELAGAGLVGFLSGKSRRQPCSYSLNGSLNGCHKGLLNGGKIYSSYDSQIESHTSENTPDLKQTKTEIETKQNILIEDDDVEARLREKEIEDAISDYCSEPDKNSNAAFPEQAFIPEKEKSCAKKEKELPAAAEVIAGLADTAYWRNVVEHHKVDEDRRKELFCLFYQQKEDHYRIRLPSKLDMAQHFYNWVPIHLNKDKIQQLGQIANGKTIPKTTRNVLKSTIQPVQQPFGKL